MNGRTTWAPLLVLLAGALLRTAALPGPATAQSRPILIRADEIHTVTNGVIEDGEILIRDGVIEQVGLSVEVPADALEYRAEVVIPGMIDAHAHLALDRSGRSRIPGPFTPEWKAVENLDLADPMIQVALSGGVTSVIARSCCGTISRTGGSVPGKDSRASRMSIATTRFSAASRSVLK